MNTITLSATAARNNFFDLLTQVASGVEVIIERDKKEVARLMPLKKKTQHEKLLKAAKETWGSIPDIEDSVLQQKGADDFLTKRYKGF